MNSSDDRQFFDHYLSDIAFEVKVSKGMQESSSSVGLSLSADLSEN